MAGINQSNAAASLQNSTIQQVSQMNAGKHSRSSAQLDVNKINHSLNSRFHPNESPVIKRGGAAQPSNSTANLIKASQEAAAAAPIDVFTKNASIPSKLTVTEMRKSMNAAGGAAVSSTGGLKSITNSVAESTSRAAAAANLSASQSKTANAEGSLSPSIAPNSAPETAEMSARRTSSKKQLKQSGI